MHANLLIKRLIMSMAFLGMGGALVANWLPWLGLLMMMLALATVMLLLTLITQGERLWVTKCMAWILGAKAVELIDFQGDRYYTICYTQASPSGQLQAPLYWVTNVGTVILREDGTVDRSSDSYFVDYWLPLNNDERAQQILVYGEPHTRQPR